MPAKQRGRRDDKRAPARSRQQTARGSEEDSIGRAQLGPSELATQHRELVAQHDDLELLELIRTEAQRRELQKPPEHEVAERPEQRAAPPAGRGGSPTLRARTTYQRGNRVNAPHKLDEAEIGAWAARAAAVTTASHSTRVFGAQLVGFVRLEFQVEHHVEQDGYVVDGLFSWDA